jgi:O-antigen/teichoic acid export membrane protein
MGLATHLRRALHIVGVDRAVGYTLLNHSWNLVVRPVTLYLTLLYLTGEELGFNYTFASILGMQVFFDLGIGVAMQQFVAYEMGKLHWSDAGTLEGDATAKSRLASLVRLMLRWYGAIAAAFLLVFLTFGTYFLSRKGVGVAWLAPWVWTVIAAVAGMLTTPAIMLIAGSGKVAESARLVGLQSVAVNVVQCLALALGCGLFSGPIGTTAGLVLMAAWLIGFWRTFLLDLYRQPRDGPAVDWWREIWPFQWRIAISWPFGYLVYQLFPLVMFYFYGPDEAGPVGASLAVANLVTNFSMAWVNPKMPRFGHMIARRDWNQLDQTFRRAFLHSTVVAVLCASAAWTVVAVAQARGHWLGTRFLPAGLMALLLGTAVLNHVIFALAAYIRAHRQDPFVWSVIVMGCVMGVSTVVTGWAYGAAGMMVAYFVLNSAFLFRCAAIFFRCRREWHRDDAPGGSGEPTEAVPEAVP